MVIITDGATDGIVEQSVEKLVIGVKSNDISSTDSVKRPSPQSRRTTMTANLDQFHQ